MSKYIYKKLSRRPSSGCGWDNRL